MRPGPHRIPLLIALAGALLMAGCATRPPEPTEPAPAPVEEPAIADEARRALALDRPLEAAALFEAAAEQSESPLRDRYLVRAAAIYARGGDLAAARRLLQTVDPAALSGVHRHRHTLIQARLALDEGRPESAWERLRQRPPGLPETVAADWRDAQASALAALDRHLDAARARIALAETLDRTAARRRQYRLIWQSLRQLDAQTRARARPTATDTLQGWLDLLARFQAHRVQPEPLRQAIAQWRQQHPGHPAGRFAAELLDDHLQRLRPPEEIALMLPLSGRLADAGKAIEQGFMAAYFQDAGPRPRLRLLDVGESGSDVISAYRDAVEAGVDLVIGPLTKQSLEALSVWDTFPVPVLALNTVASTRFPTARFYQFGLAPEDDARAAAELMASQGHGDAVVLVPDSEWGDRLASAFRAALRSRGGRVLEQARYDERASDFSGPLRRLFNLDDSRQRYVTLRRVLAAEIKFEPRRRRDMDAVFFAAFPRQARLIRPQIRFHHGIGLPAYATSHAYSGSPSPADDQDMDGLRIVEIPWLLGSVPGLDAELSRAALQSLWPERAERLPRLMAMGVDAYRLAPLVDVLRSYPGAPLPSATGAIQVAGDGVIHRLLPAAEFRDGRLHPLELKAAPFGAARP